MAHFRSWVKRNLKEGVPVVVEATGSVWDIYDIVDPLVTRTVVANAHKVCQIAEARVKTDKEDIKRLICSCLRSPSIRRRSGHLRLFLFYKTGLTDFASPGYFTFPANAFC